MHRVIFCRRSWGSPWESPGFDPPHQFRKMRIPVTGDSDVAVFMLVPKKQGTLRLNLRMMLSDVEIGSRLIVTASVSSAASLPTVSYGVVSMPMLGMGPQASVAASGVRRLTVVEAAGTGSHGTLPTPFNPDAKPLPSRTAPKPFKPVAVPPPAPLRPGVPLQTPSADARKTVYRQKSPAGGVLTRTPAEIAQRRIVGILVTYSWNPDGEIFPIREGRNLIGRDPDCDVCVSVDHAMSGHNTHITFRTNFVVGDLISMSGTDVNGEPIEQQFQPLLNYSTIRAGSTKFIFISIHPPAAHLAPR